MHNDPIIDKAIRKVPDFPKPGILFYDLTSLLAAPAAFAYTVDRMEEIYANEPLDAVAAIEARGFLLAAPYALRRQIPLILLRKKGKLPGDVISREFTLEYGTDRIEVHREDVPSGGRILVVDDLIATGGTVEAACELIEEAGATVAGVFAVVALPFLDFNTKLRDRKITYLQEYNTE
ncbi:MAG: adenine phosphoribosyltransferase [Spirochaeta sp.]|nr:adenine phosphoribosyltransferase [Spirochaeta sp.]